MADSLVGDVLFFDPDGVTVDSDAVDGDGNVLGEWCDVSTCLTFGISVKIDNAAGDLVGQVFVEAANGAKTKYQRIVWSDGDNYEAVAAATDFEHMFNISDLGFPFVRVGVLRSSGSSEANGLTAEIFRKRVR